VHKNDTPGPAECLVPFDGLEANALFNSRPGKPVPAQPEHALARFARECWDMAGGGQAVLVDWGRV
jgi:hypothetical protein